MSFNWLVRPDQSANRRSMIQDETHIRILSECCNGTITEDISGRASMWICDTCCGHLGEVNGTANVDLKKLAELPPSPSEWRNWFNTVLGMKDVEISLEWK